jgi:hypothetical protein
VAASHNARFVTQPSARSDVRRHCRDRNVRAARRRVDHDLDATTPQNCNKPGNRFADDTGPALGFVVMTFSLLGLYVGVRRRTGSIG